jgi:type III pantothenate kinase
MLLALDVGNTNTILGLYLVDEDQTAAATASRASEPDPSSDNTRVHLDLKLAAHWRVTTHRSQTSDEYGVLFLNLFNMSGISVGQVKYIIISSVVPPVESTLRRVCEKYFHLYPMFVEPGIKTGMPVLVDNPTELGADRLVNAIAAYERYGGPCIVVDFGTATTFDVISAKGEYLGGAIAPGLGISADALFARAARLGRVDVKRPAKVIGTNTVTHLQSGLYYGLVDGIIERMSAELGAQPRVIATGGLARQISGDSRYIAQIDDMLTLDGLRILFERNRTARPRSRAH